MKRLLSYLIAVVIVGAALWHIRSHFADLRLLPQIISHANSWLIIGALGAVILTYIADGLLSLILLKIVSFPLHLSQTVSVAIIDVFASQILPVGQAGTVAATYFLYHRLGVDTKQFIFLSTNWSISTSIAQISLFILSLIFLPLNETRSILISGLQWGFTALIIISGLIVVALVTPLKKYLGRFWTKFKNRSLGGESLRRIIVRGWQTAFENPRLTAQAMSSAFLYYLASIACLWLSLTAVGLHVSPIVATFALSISYFATVVSLVPGGLGVAESSLVVVLLGFTPQAAQIVTGVLLFRALTFWLPLILGGSTYFYFIKSTPVPKATNPKF